MKNKTNEKKKEAGSTRMMRRCRERSLYQTDLT